jgi:hypothetical protein
MISGVARWRCKCGVSVKAVTETDKVRINENVRIDAVCPKCGDRQPIYAHHIIEITTEKPDIIAGDSN